MMSNCSPISVYHSLLISFVVLLPILTDSIESQWHSQGKFCNDSNFSWSLDEIIPSWPCKLKYLETTYPNVKAQLTVLSPHIWVSADMRLLPFINHKILSVKKFLWFHFASSEKSPRFFWSISFLFVNVSFLSDVFQVSFFLLTSYFPLVLTITSFDSSLLVSPISPW